MDYQKEQRQEKQKDLKEIDLSNDIIIVGGIKQCKNCLSNNIKAYEDPMYGNNMFNRKLIQCENCLKQVVSYEPISNKSLIKKWNEANSFNCKIHKVKSCNNCIFFKGMKRCCVGGNINTIDNVEKIVCDEWRECL